MRYLLDELMTYEDGFSDMLMSTRRPERHENFMGEHNDSAILTKGDLGDFADVFSQSILSKIPSLIAPLIANYQLAELPSELIIAQSFFASLIITLYSCRGSTFWKGKV